MKMLEGKAIEIVENLESEPEVVAKLVTLQEKISSRPTKFIEPLFETHVDLLAEPTLELVPSLAVMRASIFLRSSDVYDPLKIFLQEPVSQKIGTLICGLDVSGGKSICHVVCILLELPSTATCLSRKSAPAPPPPSWS